MNDDSQMEEKFKTRCYVPTPQCLQVQMLMLTVTDLTVGPQRVDAILLVSSQQLHQRAFCAKRNPVLEF